METRKLSNGVLIPSMGFGTWRIQESPFGGENVVRAAIEAGWRHIDGADSYDNQVIVGRGIAPCLANGVCRREDLFVTSKVPWWKQGYESTMDCCRESLRQLGLDYFDLYLIHDPNRRSEHWQTTVIDTWRALETLHSQGLVRSIGISNFSIKHLEFLFAKANIKPQVHQIEVHPQHQQREVVAWSTAHGMLIETWHTLNAGHIFESDVARQVAAGEVCSVAELAVRWSLTKGYVPILSSHKPERNAANLKISSEPLSAESMRRLDSLDGGPFSGWHQDSAPVVRMVPLSEVLSGGGGIRQPRPTRFLDFRSSRRRLFPRGLKRSGISWVCA